MGRCGTAGYAVLTIWEMEPVRGGGGWQFSIRWNEAAEWKVVRRWLADNCGPHGRIWFAMFWGASAGSGEHLLLIEDKAKAALFKMVFSASFAGTCDDRSKANARS